MLVLAVGLAISCGGTTGTATTPPGGTGAGGVDPGPEGINEGSGMAELQRRLEDLVRRTDGMSAVAAGDAAKCESLCDLATSICTVSQKMEELCNAHPDDDNYAALCREAKNECREAQESCVRCVENNQSVGPER